ncbi:uncharacterized protein LOC110393511 [Numida meleagris]|uniref:uncharacterized protein LOC110393511 n=1 Tax=Numida meleagris TaxID=8996 RepID=UPI000B3DA05A|nr:uncharacterized protein LOC110393511 [Numida meleagris]
MESLPPRPLPTTTQKAAPVGGRRKAKPLVPLRPSETPRHCRPRQRHEPRVSARSLRPRTIKQREKSEAATPRVSEGSRESRGNTAACGERGHGPVPPPTPSYPRPPRPRNGWGRPPSPGGVKGAGAAPSHAPSGHVGARRYPSTGRSGADVSLPRVPIGPDPSSRSDKRDPFSQAEIKQKSDVSEAALPPEQRLQSGGCISPPGAGSGRPRVVPAPPPTAAAAQLCYETTQRDAPFTGRPAFLHPEGRKERKRIKNKRKKRSERSGSGSAGRQRCGRGSSPGVRRGGRGHSTYLVPGLRNS